jgi:xanthine dehydrogenase YagS FAD-binding subunit
VKNFTYSRASAVGDALTSAQRYSGATRFLAGGTTVIDLLKLGALTTDNLVDITGIGGLDEISTSGSELRFGALATMANVAAEPTLVRDYPILSESLWKAASQQLRNMATVGGNVLQRTRCQYFRSANYPCNKKQPGSGCAAIDGHNRGHALFGGSDSCIATYPGDLAVALIALDAVVDTTSPRGSRSIAFADLHLLPGNTPHVETRLEQDELIVRIRVPATPLGQASVYHKVRDRESYAFATVSCAAALHIVDGVVADARIALGGVAAKPWRASDAETLLVGKPFTEAAAQAAGTASFTGAKTTDENRFKLSLGPRVVARALILAHERRRT